MTDEIGNVEEGFEEEIDNGAGSDEIMEGIVSDEEYEPNFIYSVKDEEREFNDYVKTAITSKEAEDYFRDLHTKADGLDSYKEKVTGLEEELGRYPSVVENLQKGYYDMKTYRDQGDYRQLFKSLGVKESDIVKYAYDIAKEEELPEEQREMIRTNREYQDRLAALEGEVNHFRSNSAQQTVNNDLQELGSYVSQNADLDKMMGDAGFNLRNEILSYGITTTKITGVEPSLREAADVVVGRYKNMFNRPVQETQQETVQKIINGRQQTLPKINGTNHTNAEERMTMTKLRELARTQAR